MPHVLGRHPAPAAAVLQGPPALQALQVQLLQLLPCLQAALRHQHQRHDGAGVRPDAPAVPVRAVRLHSAGEGRPEEHPREHVLLPAGALPVLPQRLPQEDALLGHGDPPPHLPLQAPRLTWLMLLVEALLEVYIYLGIG